MSSSRGDGQGSINRGGTAAMDRGEPLFDAVLFRSLMEEWVATREVGWSRPLSIEEAICVLTAVEQGYTTTALDERTYHRG